jgi:hypothetical protein
MPVDLFLETGVAESMGDFISGERCPIEYVSKNCMDNAKYTDFLAKFPTNEESLPVN